MDAFEWLHDVWINGQEMRDYCLKTGLFYNAYGMLTLYTWTWGNLKEEFVQWLCVCI